MTHHVLVHRDRHMLAAVIDVERQADELRQDGGTARPGLDRTRTATGVMRHFRLLQKAEVHERTFPDGTSHLTYHFFVARRLRVKHLSVYLVWRRVGQGEM